MAGSCGYSGALTTRVLLLFWERPLIINTVEWDGGWVIQLVEVTRSVGSPIPRHWKGLLGEQARNR